MSHDQELRDVARLYAEGRITEAEYEQADAAIRARMPREGRRGNVVPLGRVRSLFPPKRRCRSPDRLASLERRRTIAASGPMPPGLACRYTTGQLAVLGIVGDEIAVSGACVLTIGEIAARAGVSHRLAQDAIRLAELDGLVRIEERPRRGDRNLPNRLTVLSREWSAWLRRRGRGGGCRNARPSDRGSSSPRAERPAATVLTLPGRRLAAPQAAPPAPPRPALAGEGDRSLSAALERFQRAWANRE
ncbi:hypothetical protein [Methylobacterium sp. WSM2598]|uniref:hypothetical protein n=1 Tax=Methylobacterium sp. WSM2598 TaxID=398261 RepID=UPI000367113E|nr:hypothetical protein [Methylobacterium sp. WSM2598]